MRAIRLAWWREALERLDHAPPPPEPRLLAVAAELVPRGVSGTDLGGLEAGWATLLDEPPRRDLIERRGTLLFELAARLLGEPSPGLAEAGAMFATIDVARRGLLAPIPRPATLRLRIPRAQRPLTALAVLAARDAWREGSGWEPEATPARALALLAHRLTGRLVI